MGRGFVYFYLKRGEMETLEKSFYTIEEYHTLERGTETKYEYHRGEVFAMAGGEPEHGVIGGNIITLLNQALTGKPCIVGGSDLKVRVESQDRTFYPDVSVFCDQPKRSEKESIALINPLLIAEVISDSTEAYDRGAKFDYYSYIPTLKCYLIVEQKRKAVQLFHRESQKDIWKLQHFHEGDVIEIMHLNIQLSVNDLYRGVDLISSSI